jgi:hypothetical protein
MKQGKKQPKRRSKKVFRRRLVWGLTAVILAVSGLIIYSLLNLRNQTNPNGTPTMKAAIVDHLSDSSPNQTFVENCKSILKNASFATYYYSKVAVDVSFYRNLPNQGFDLIILRVHSAVNEESDLLVFFTSEPFSESAASTTYLSDFLCDPPRLVRARMYEGAKPFFGITPSFVGSMRGGFDHTIIIMMGCTGLGPQHTSMAEALVEKGAEVYIGLDGLVSPSHTDQMTTVLLQKLLAENKTVQNAVSETNSEVGPDPMYKSKMSWYPATEGDFSFTKILQTASTLTGKTFSNAVTKKKSEDASELYGYYRDISDVYDAVSIDVCF